MSCPTGKRRYKGRPEAERGLAEVTKTQGFLRERRAYYCPQCHNWHLTSEARGGAAYTFDTPRFALAPPAICECEPRVAFDEEGE
jgi:hypothetical protein